MDDPHKFGLHHRIEETDNNKIKRAWEDSNLA
jgi:hypothetical protein